MKSYLQPVNSWCLPLVFAVTLVLLIEPSLQASQEEGSKRDPHNILRFGRTPHNIMRFGRAGHNILHFGKRIPIQAETEEIPVPVYYEREVPMSSDTSSVLDVADPSSLLLNSYTGSFNKKASDPRGDRDNVFMHFG